MIGFYNYTVVATYLATLLGLCGIFFSLEGQVFSAIVCLLLAGLLDTVDGRIARTKKDRTADEQRFGIQIDSLNDVICFGVLPATAGYTLCRAHMETLPLWCKATLGFFLLAGLIRLAYFNVLEEERQQTEGGTERRYYLGLPITASTLVFPALYLLGRLFPGAAPAILCGGLLLTGLLYITPLHLRHPNGIAIVGMAAVGAAELAGLLLLR